MALDAEELDEIDRMQFLGETAPLLGAEQAKVIARDGDFTLAVLANEEDEFKARKLIKIAETFKQRARTSTWQERLTVISGIAAAIVLITQSRRRLREKENRDD